MEGPPVEPTQHIRNGLHQSKQRNSVLVQRPLKVKGLCAGSAQSIYSQRTLWAKTEILAESPHLASRSDFSSGAVSYQLFEP